MARAKGKAAVDKLNRRLETLSVEYVPVADIKGNPWNPNRQSEHEFELLRRSIREDGFTQPVVCVRVSAEDRKDDRFKGYQVGDVMIVDGEHRWRAAAEEGYDEIPVVIAPFTAVQARIATMRHNKARGQHDIELEADLLRDLQALGAAEWAQESLMLDDVEMQRMLDDISAPEALAADALGEGWEPGERTSEESGTFNRFGADAQVSQTPEAVAQLRAAEERARKARTDEERQQARRDVQYSGSPSPSAARKRRSSGRCSATGRPSRWWRCVVSARARKLISGGPDMRVHIAGSDGQPLCAQPVENVQLAISGDPSCGWCKLIDSETRKGKRGRAVHVPTA